VVVTTVIATTVVMIVFVMTVVVTTVIVPTVIEPTVIVPTVVVPIVGLPFQQVFRFWKEIFQLWVIFNHFQNNGQSSTLMKVSQTVLQLAYVVYF
jgi:hypothetical protein